MSPSRWLRKSCGNPSSPGSTKEGLDNGGRRGYLTLFDGGLVPFFSGDEPDDDDFRPRLVVILK